MAAVSICYTVIKQKTMFSPFFPHVVLEMRQGNIFSCACGNSWAVGTLALWPLHICRALLMLSLMCDQAIQLCHMGRYSRTDVTDGKWEAAQGSWFVWEKWLKDTASPQTHTNIASFLDACGKKKPTGFRPEQALPPHKSRDQKSQSMRNLLFILYNDDFMQ